MRTNLNMEVMHNNMKLFYIIFLSMLNLSQSTNVELKCNNKSFVCYNRELYYPCVQVGDSNSVVVSDLQHCPKGSVCDDNADTACRRIESVENISDQDHTSNLTETTDKTLSTIEKNSKLHNDTIPLEDEVILTTILKSDFRDMFTHDTTVTSSMQLVTKTYDVVEENSNQTDEKLTTIAPISTIMTNHPEINETSSTNFKITQDSTLTSTTESGTTEGIDNMSQNYLSLDQNTDVKDINNTILDNNKILQNNTKVSGNSGLNDRNLVVGDDTPHSTTNFNDLVYNVKVTLDNHILVDRSNEDDDYITNTDPTTLLESTTIASIVNNNDIPSELIIENATVEPNTIQPSTDLFDDIFEREADEVANFLKLTQQATLSSMEINTVTDATETTDISNENEFEQITIPFNQDNEIQRESQEYLDTVKKYLDATLPSTIIESISDKNNIPIKLMIENVTIGPIPSVNTIVPNIVIGVQREAEELENFLKLTHQSTNDLNVTINDHLADQTESSTVQDIIINPGPTAVIVQHVSDENELGQAEIVGTENPVIQYNKFETESDEDLNIIQDNFESIFLPITDRNNEGYNTTLSTNQESQFIVGTETAIEDISNINKTNIENNKLEREHEEDKHFHQLLLQATPPPVKTLSSNESISFDSEIDSASTDTAHTEYKGVIIQSNLPGELHETTLSANQQLQFGNNIDNVETTLESIADQNEIPIVNVIGNVTLEQPLITANDKIKKDYEDAMNKVQHVLQDPAIATNLNIEYGDSGNETVVPDGDPGSNKTNQSNGSLNTTGLKENSNNEVTMENTLEQIPIISSDSFQTEFGNDDGSHNLINLINQNLANLGTINNATNPSFGALTMTATTLDSVTESGSDLHPENSLLVETIIIPPNTTINKDGNKKDKNKNTEDSTKLNSHKTTTVPAPHLESISLNPNILKTDFVCKVAGQFPDPKNCSIYHVCMDIYIRILHFPAACPPGTLYDRNLQNCTRRPVECSEDNTLQCTTSGVFAHPTDCNRYYKCFWRSLHKKFSLWQFKCPTRMRYDQERRKCVNAAASTLECGGLSQDSAESPFYCTENGRFPMEYNCDGYYDCKEKKGAFQTKAKFCSQGKLFDTELGRCRRSDLVFCPYEYDNVDGDGNISVEID